MKYSDIKDKIIYNGDTTIVYGVGKPNKQLAQKLMKEFGALYFEEGCNYSDNIVVQGVTHCDSDDVYDKTTGLKIASRKAELKARDKMFNNYSKIRNKLMELLNLVEVEMLFESNRCFILEKELEEARNK